MAVEHIRFDSHLCQFMCLSLLINLLFRQQSKGIRLIGCRGTAQFGVSTGTSSVHLRKIIVCSLLLHCDCLFHSRYYYWIVRWQVLYKLDKCLGNLFTNAVWHKQDPIYVVDYISKAVIRYYVRMTRLEYFENVKFKKSTQSK